jgi:hypothetical protein
MGAITRPIPHDFHIFAAIEGDLRLRRRYSCGGVRITAWRKESGVYCEDPRARRGVTPKVKVVAVRRGRKPSPLTWYDPEEEDYSDVFDQLGISRRGVIEW